MPTRYAPFIFLLLIPFLLQAVSEQPHHTTAYIGEPGEIDILFSYSRYSTNHFWNRHGKRLPTFSRFTRDSCLLYIEYALNRYNSLLISGGYSAVREELNGNSQGVEDLELGWKAQLYRDERAALTLQLIGIIPIGDKKSSIRYGKVGGELDILYSQAFDHSVWTDLSLGYRWYQGFPSDQLRSSAALGYCPFSRVSFIASLQLDYGLGSGKKRKNFNNIAFHPNYRLLEGQIEALFALSSCVAISVGGFQHLWGENIGTSGGGFCGIWMEF